MEVTFLRTGERRYAIVARPDGRPPVTMNPAPGFDPRIPHDLIHYAEEREFATGRGVFGQLAAGGDAHIGGDDARPHPASPRPRRGARRRRPGARRADRPVRRFA